MQKIKTVFEIEREGARRATNKVVESSQWVLDGEGIATVKFEGTACLIKDGILYKRYDAKKGKTPPVGFIPAQDADPVTGHWPGWIMVGDGPEDKYHRAASHQGLEDGTYELVGPKIQGNRYGLTGYELWKHGSKVVHVERTREAIIEWLESHHEEGLVFHHPDGRMAKIRRKDFGFVW